MPIYEYSCQSCRNSFEELVPSPAEAVACPRCESRDVKRELSVFSSPAGSGEKPAMGGCCSPGGCGCR
jgi:putative FmdB family regulatory protein